MTAICAETWLEPDIIEIAPEEIRRVGCSGIRSYQEYYDEETQSFDEHLYQYEIDRFGYSFEDLH